MGVYRNLVNEKFNRLTVLEKTELRQGTSVVWKCICDCGNTTFAATSSLKSNHKKSCGCLHTEQRVRLGQSKTKDLSNQKFSLLTALSPTKKIKDGRIVWLCKCDCGSICEVSSSDLIRRRVSSCGCAHINSKGEQKIKTILLNNNISFKQEQTFEDCFFETGKKARFDFFINNEYLIEFDGRQHFLYDPSGYGQEILNIKKRDSFKNQWCLEHNIKLIRIPYTILEKLTIKDLQLETTQYLLRKEDILYGNEC